MKTVMVALAACGLLMSSAHADAQKADQVYEAQLVESCTVCCVAQRVPIGPNLANAGAIEAQLSACKSTCQDIVTKTLSTRK